MIRWHEPPAGADLPGATLVARSAASGVRLSALWLRRWRTLDTLGEGFSRWWKSSFHNQLERTNEITLLDGIMRLFDDTPRTYRGRADHTEGTFNFLNRSALPEYGHVRDLLECYFSRYPSIEQSELRKKFRSQFETAFFELFTYELLLRLGCAITVHPTLDKTNKKPDFLARFPQGEEVIIEAVVATDLSDAERARKTRLNTLYDKINSNLGPTNFFLSITDITDRSNRNAIPIPKNILHSIKKVISGLDADSITQAIEHGREYAFPQWTYRHRNGFELEIGVVPKSPGTRDDPEIPAIGMMSGETRWGNSNPALKNSINKKATRYGKMDKPYVVIVNALSDWILGRDDEVENLYGPAGTDGITDAVWNRNKNTRLSGVLITRVWPWSVHDARMCLYHNPFAANPCTNIPWNIPQYIRQGLAGRWLEGRTSADIFELQSNWRCPND